MSDKDMKSTGSENVSKRKFLKKAGATAGAITSVTLVKRVQASELSSQSTSPDGHCSNETIRSNADACQDCYYCNIEESLGGYSTVTAKLYLSDDPNGDDWGEFKAHNASSRIDCSTGSFERVVDITDSYHGFQFDNPDDVLTLYVGFDDYGATGTFDLVLEKCV